MSKRKGVRAFTRLLYAVVAIEVVLAVVCVVGGRGGPTEVIEPCDPKPPGSDEP